MFIQCGNAPWCLTCSSRENAGMSKDKMGKLRLPSARPCSRQCLPSWSPELASWTSRKKDALVVCLKAKGILSEHLKWQFLSWYPEAKALQPNQKTPLTSDNVCQTLTLSGSFWMLAWLFLSSHGSYKVPKCFLVIPGWLGSLFAFLMGEDSGCPSFEGFLIHRQHRHRTHPKTIDTPQHRTRSPHSGDSSMTEDLNKNHF